MFAMTDLTRFQSFTAPSRLQEAMFTALSSRLIVALG